MARWGKGAHNGTELQRKPITSTGSAETPVDIRTLKAEQGVTHTGASTPAPRVLPRASVNQLSAGQALASGSTF